jgi:hypothetical protein
MVKTIRTGDPVWAELQGLRVALGLRTMEQVLQHLLAVRRQLGHTQGNLAADPILALSGLGKDAWKGVDADKYVAQLREGW